MLHQMLHLSEIMLKYRGKLSLGGGSDAGRAFLNLLRYYRYVLE
jgi:hypothetical protein